jgi:hypothetical protein
MGDGRDSVDLADLFGLDGARVRVGRPVARAQQGLLYLRQGTAEAVKLYTPAYLLRSAAELRAKLTWMIDHPPVDPGTSQRSLGWPRTLVVDGAGGLAGYTMPAPPRTVELRQLTVAHDPTEGGQAADGGRSDQAPAGWAGRFDDWRTRVETAASLAALTAALHDAGYVVGNFTDTVVRVTSRGQAILTDCDRIQVTTNGRTYLGGVGGPEFTPPELLAERGRPLSPAADDFALAVHCFGLLLGGHRPYSGLWRAGGQPPAPLQLARWGLYGLAGDERLGPPPGLPPAELLPASVRTLVELAFGPGAGVAQRRPAAADWRDALSALATGLQTCPRNPSHHFRPGLEGCPWCAPAGDARRGAAAPEPAGSGPPTVGLPASAADVPAPPSRPRVAAVPAPASRPAGGRARRGPAHRSPRGRPAAHWAVRLTAALFCVLGATLLLLNVLGSAAPLTGRGGTDGATAAGPPAATAAGASARASSQTASGAAPAPRRWLGEWVSGATSLLPGFALTVRDDGPAGRQERIVATQTSGSCPVRYEGLVTGGSGATEDAAGDLVLDAHLPADADPSGCALLPSRSSYTAAGGESTSAAAIRIAVTGAAGDLAQAWVVLRPGQTVGLTLNRA